MSLVTLDKIRAVYTMLLEFGPFAGWGLPPADEVTFDLIEGSDFGHYNDQNGCHAIGINPEHVMTIRGLVYVVAHEMTHMRQELVGKRPSTKEDQHNKEFNRLGRMVCKRLMIPPEEFF